MQDGKTIVQDCSKALSKDTKALINVLQYSNGARVFFTDKVLLVEGISDEEFFTAYLRNVYPKTDIEVLSTNTKDQISKWRKIIEEFGIKVCSISDLDSAKRKEIKRKPTRQKQDRTSLIKSDVDPAEYQKLLKIIQNKTNEYTYILKEGALESYVPGTSSDKVQRVRDFLDSAQWSTVRHSKELKDILHKVVAY